MRKINVNIRRAKYPIVVKVYDTKNKKPYVISIERLESSVRITLPIYKCIDIMKAALATAGQTEWKPNYARHTLTLRIPISEKEGKNLKILIEGVLKLKVEEIS